MVSVFWMIENRWLTTSLLLMKVISSTFKHATHSDTAPSLITFFCRNQYSQWIFATIKFFPCKILIAVCILHLAGLPTYTGTIACMKSYSTHNHLCYHYFPCYVLTEVSFQTILVYVWKPYIDIWYKIKN